MIRYRDYWYVVEIIDTLLRLLIRYRDYWYYSNEKFRGNGYIWITKSGSENNDKGFLGFLEYAANYLIYVSSLTIIKQS